MTEVFLWIGGIAGIVAIGSSAVGMARWWRSRDRPLRPKLPIDGPRPAERGPPIPPPAAYEARGDFPDGVALREKRDDRVYVIVGGAKVWLPGPVWYERFGEPQIQVLPAGSLARVPDRPRDGTLVREWSDKAVYFIERGERSLVETHGGIGELDTSAVHVVPDGYLTGIPLVARPIARQVGARVYAYRGEDPNELRYETLDVSLFKDEAKGVRLDPRSVPGGRRVVVVVSVRNTGSVAWRSGGPAPMRIGTWNPQDHLSGFFTSGWVSLNRPATLAEIEVVTGECGTFEFPVALPPEKGHWVEHFNLVAENWAWARHDHRLRLEIRVDAAYAAAPGE